jgi:hypothetical protein
MVPKLIMGENAFSIIKYRILTFSPGKSASMSLLG